MVGWSSSYGPLDLLLAGSWSSVPWSSGGVGPVYYKQKINNIVKYLKCVILVNTYIKHEFQCCLVLWYFPSGPMVCWSSSYGPLVLWLASSWSSVP